MGAREQGPVGRWAIPVVRASLFALTASLASLTTPLARELPWLVALGVLALASAASSRHARAHCLALTAEAACAALATTSTGGADSPLFAYLLAPALDAGVTGGSTAAVLVAGATAAALLARLPGTLPGRAFALATGQWVLTVLGAGEVAAWARRLAAARRNDEHARATQAYRLLEDLRALAHRLPGSLDPLTAARELLEAAAAELGAASGLAGAVLVPSGAGRLVPLALLGWPQLPASLGAAEPQLLAALRAGSAVVLPPAGPSPLGDTLTAVPLAAPGADPATGGDGLALLVLTSRRRLDGDHGLRRVTAEHGVRLASALLFEQLRTTAAIEERGRLAREIHDGIAQELAAFGYRLDALRAELDPADGLRSARAELSRLLSELRLSMFDLRQGADPWGGLAVALGEHARTLAAGGRHVVHLNLHDVGRRLPTRVEVEFLRIADEATAAACAGGAGQVWLTLEASGERVVLTVEGDGSSQPGADTLALLGERAARVGAVLASGSRDPRGGWVRVTAEGVGAGAEAIGVTPAPAGVV